MYPSLLMVFATWLLISKVSAQLQLFIDGIVEGPSTSIDISHFATVQDIATKISDMTGEPADEIVVEFQGESLNMYNDSSDILISDTGISSEATVRCGIRSHQVFIISHYLERQLAFHVRASTTVEQLAHMIQWSKDGIPCAKQRLIFSGRNMLFNRKLTDYNVVKDSRIHLLMRLGGLKQLSQDKYVHA